MRYSTLALAALPAVYAFPSEVFKRAKDAEKREADAKIAVEYMERRQLAGSVPPFDPNVQYVSNTGAHAFSPPSGSDQRGPCPGLNA